MSQDPFVREVLEASSRSDQYPFNYISGQVLLNLAQKYSLDPGTAQELTLEQGINLERYLRNYQTLDLDMQLSLARSRVLLVGLGGLGGFVLEMLARCGAGYFWLADGDVFEESNLNRQLLCTMPGLGKPKSKAARERIPLINPFSRVVKSMDFLGPSDLPGLIPQVDLVLDCLGGTEFRMSLLQSAQQYQRPLVTGFLAGRTGLVSTVFPGDKNPAHFWGKSREQGAEIPLGNVVTTVAMVASIQAEEALAIISGQEPRFRSQVFMGDLSSGTFQTLKL